MLPTKNIFSYHFYSFPLDNGGGMLPEEQPRIENLNLAQYVVKFLIAVIFVRIVYNFYFHIVLTPN